MIKLLFKSRRGMHVFEWVAVVAAVALGVALMRNLAVHYWNARVQFYDDTVQESYYDPFNPGSIDIPQGGPCDCTDWFPINACGVGECGFCEKVAFRGCAPLECGETNACFTPGESVPDCPGCSQGVMAEPCPPFVKNLECWSDDPSAELLLELFGNNTPGALPCEWGQMIYYEITCPGENKEYKCKDMPFCEFQCLDAPDPSKIGTWYNPCPNIDPPNNNHTYYTFVESCTGAPCEYTCAPPLVPDSTGSECVCPEGLTLEIQPDGSPECVTSPPDGCCRDVCRNYAFDPNLCLAYGCVKDNWGCHNPTGGCTMQAPGLCLPSQWCGWDDHCDDYAGPCGQCTHTSQCPQWFFCVNGKCEQQGGPPCPL